MIDNNTFWRFGQPAGGSRHVLERPQHQGSESDQAKAWIFLNVLFTRPVAAKVL
jgi:hypothetical protein